MSAPAVVVRFDPSSSGRTFWNGQGLLLYEQRRLRRADSSTQVDRALSPFASLRRRIPASVLSTSSAQKAPRKNSPRA